MRAPVSVASAPAQVFLGLGSNLGDRTDNLRRALQALRQTLVVDRVSFVYDTAPMLVGDQPRFLNLACGGNTPLDPLALLWETQRIERQLGRTPGRRYGPRVIDIDLLFYDDRVVDTPDLTLPHPRIAERAFVLLPLAEIAPALRHPLLGRTIAELAAALPAADVRLLGPLPRTSS